MSIQIAYNPRPQFIGFHQRNTRWSCIVAHRRCGKTVACINDLHERALYSQKHNPRYAYIAPFYSQAKNIAWDYLKEATLETAVKVSESMLSVELFNGARITLYGADNPNTLRGLYFDGVVLDEYGDCRPSLWGEVILPTLADRKGWAVFIGTPKGKNHFYDIWRRSQEENWFNITLRASETGILDDGELAEMQAQMTEDQFLQEFECSFEAAVVGTYYAHLIATAEREGRVGIYPFNPDLDVSVSSDLGKTDSSAFWFWQEYPDRYQFIDYHEADGQNLDHYFAMFDQKAQELKYNYKRIWLPHDAKASTLSSKRSTIEQFLDHFGEISGDAGNIIDIQPRLKKQHGIDASRFLIPQSTFHAPSCAEGIEALRAYRRSYNEKTQQFSNEPLHDWSSNGSDAYRGFAVAAKTGKMPASRDDVLVEYHDKIRQQNQKFTLSDLFKEHEAEIRSLSRHRGRIT